VEKHPSFDGMILCSELTGFLIRVITCWTQSQNTSAVSRRARCRNTRPNGPDDITPVMAERKASTLRAALAGATRG
jgi:hypothetical protein